MKFLPAGSRWLVCCLAIFATVAVFYDAGIPYHSAILYTGAALGWFTSWARRFFDRPMYPLLIGMAVMLGVITLMVDNFLELHLLLAMAGPVMAVSHLLIHQIFKGHRSVLETAVLASCLLTAPVLSRLVLWTQEETMLAYIETLPFSQEGQHTGGVRVGVYTIVHATRFPDGQAILFTSSCIEACGEHGGHGGWMYNPPPRPTALPRAQRQFEPSLRNHAFGDWWKLPSAAAYWIWGA